MDTTALVLYNQNKEKFYKYLKLLLKWNTKINLTSIVSPEEVRELHFIDSLSLVPHLVSRETIKTSRDISLLDIGSGGGFPGIPIKIAMPQLKVTLVDSVKKKCDFMKTIIRELGLNKIEVAQKTIREGGEGLGKFDLIVSRATFSMSELIHLSHRFLAPGGTVVSYKGASVADEISDAMGPLERYGFGPIREFPYKLPFSGIERKLLITGLITGKKRRL